MYTGERISVIRDAVASMSPPERRRWNEKRLLALASKAASVATSRITGLGAGSGTVQISSTLHHKDAPEPKFRGIHVSRDFALVEAVGLLKNRHDWQGSVVLSGLHMESDLVFDPKARKILHSNAPVDITARFGTLSRRRSPAGTLTQISTVLDVPRQRIPVGDKPRFKAFLNEVLRGGLALVVVSANSAPSTSRNAIVSVDDDDNSEGDGGASAPPQTSAGEQ